MIRYNYNIIVKNDLNALQENNKILLQAIKKTKHIFFWD